MNSEGRRSSFFSLTADSQPDDPIERIEIPLFQRDFAQGRQSDRVRQIRNDFLDVLLAAVKNEEADVGLDFVYGGVDEGTLRPLDGQQRLTTLFLLHWYIASRSGHLAEDHGWKRFTYATRPSARMFCERLVENPLPEGTSVPSKWIRNQPWYLFLWRHDPTIQSMLVMIDAIHERFRSVEATAAWTRLTDAGNPAIWFQLLPLSGLGSAAGEEMRAEDLYIKMNSRGKPLTDFENFKANFEKTIQSSPRAGDFAFKVDTTWSDLLWEYRGEGDDIDDEFMRYLEFVTEICEWRDGRVNGAGKRLSSRTRDVFRASNRRREDHLRFLFEAFDVWEGRSIPQTFLSLFTTASDDGGDGSKVRLFFRNDSDQLEPLNLFQACCRSYGETRGRARVFSLGQTLFLYAVLLHLIEDTSEFPRRVRILRNLVEASSDELRPDRMPRILEDVHHIIRDGDIDAVAMLNQAQVADERRKVNLLRRNPELEKTLFALEDHELLHGSLGAFQLDAATFAKRAGVFKELMSQPRCWSDLLGALLAVGEYQRKRTNSRPFLFGTNLRRYDNAWRELLTGATLEHLQPTRTVLAKLLDRLAGSDSTTKTMKEITDEYVKQCERERRFDWRYYMVRYPSMREQGSSTYFAEGGLMGYSLCMMPAGRRNIRGYYRDPYLLAISRELEDRSIVEDKWFLGYETQPRWLPLTRSGTALRCVAKGFELSPPPSSAYTAAFEAACTDLGVEANLVPVSQAQVEGRRVDTLNRIQRGAEILRRLGREGL